MSSQDHDPCQRCLRYHPPGAPCGRIEYLAPDSHEACRAEAVALRAENARLLRTNGRRERAIARARIQEEGTPVTPEWLGWAEWLYTDATITQRVCSALRRAWDERDKARALIATAPHADACAMRVQAIFRDGCEPDCDCWKSRADA